MNNSINYSGFVEMFLDSQDDYEPYGCTLSTTSPEETVGNTNFYSPAIHESDFDMQ